jgi:hypothetical protein
VPKIEKEIEDEPPHYNEVPNKKRKVSFDDVSLDEIAEKLLDNINL